MSWNSLEVWPSFLGSAPWPNMLELSPLTMIFQVFWEYGHIWCQSNIFIRQSMFSCIFIVGLLLAGSHSTFFFKAVSRNCCQPTAVSSCVFSHNHKLPYLLNANRWIYVTCLSQGHLLIPHDKLRVSASNSERWKKTWLNSVGLQCNHVLRNSPKL